MIRFNSYWIFRRARFGFRAGAVLMLVAVFFGSCLKDHSGSPGADMPKDGRMMFRISIPRSALPSTRAIADGSEDDNAVESVTLLLFDTGDGTYAGKVAATEINTPDNGASNIKTFTASVPAGAFGALVIANADDVVANLEASNPAIASEDIDYFEQNLTVSIIGGDGDEGYLKWNSSPGSPGYRPFPMAGRLEITEERSSTPATVFLARMLAKIDVKLAFEQIFDGDTDAIYHINSVLVPDFNTNGNLIPGYAEGTTLSVFAPLQLNIPTSVGRVSGSDDNLVYSGIQIQSLTIEDVELPGQQCVDEIFLPEFDPSDGSACLLLEIFVPSLEQYRWFRVDLATTNPATDAPEPVNLLRNFRYTVNITAITGNGFVSSEEAYASPSVGVVSDITAIDESDMNDITFDGNYQLTTNTSRLVFFSKLNSSSESFIQKLKVFTDYPGGWKIVENTISDFIVPWIFDGPGGITSEVNIQHDSRGSVSMVETGTIIIEAGPLRKAIDIFIMPITSDITGDAAPPAGFTPYAGAFWKAGQTGERLIRMVRPTTNPQDVDGNWVAMILEGRDWIVLDTEMTTDPNVGWLPGADESNVDNGNVAGFDGRHQIVGDDSWVTGTLDADNDDIYFRIGLNGPHKPTEDQPARYGVVLVAYNNYTKLQRIWVRQGEGPDYLMRSDDPVNSAGVISRANAAKFSPYNLTAETLNAQIYKYGTTDEGTAASKFTDYPSQGGALFVWGAGVGNWAIRYAWDQISPVPYDWKDAGNINTSWDNIAADNETCPEGYRRPNDGPSDVKSGMNDVSELELSEVRLSLFDKFGTGTGDMAATNFSRGYYADGFFDRRAISADGINVSASSDDIACSGVIYFNPANFASLFFPNTRVRDNYGAFRSASTAYWTTGMPLYNNTCRFFNESWIYYGSTSNLYPIRCVKDKPVVP